MSEKPRICEIIGVELGEKFKIRGYDKNPCKVKYSDDYDKVLVVNTYGMLSHSTLMNLIEHPEWIEKIPIHSKEQKQIFKALKILGYNYITRDTDGSLYIHEIKPIRRESEYHNGKYYWDSDDSQFEISTDRILKQSLLNFINSDDEEPFEIPEVE